MTAHIHQEETGNKPALVSLGMIFFWQLYKVHVILIQFYGVNI